MATYCVLDGAWLSMDEGSPLAPIRANGQTYVPTGEVVVRDGLAGWVYAAVAEVSR